MGALIALAAIAVFVLIVLRVGDPGRTRVRARRHLPARPAEVAAQGPGPLPADPDHRQDGPSRPADGDAERAAAGGDHEGQRPGPRERGRLLPDHRPREGDRAGRELHGRDLADRPDHPAQRPRPARLDELLSERDKINAILQQIIDEATSPWGVKVSIVEVKDVEIPTGMQRAMARQAEAERERRAKVIAAEGEFQASERLKDAARCCAEPDVAPAALPPDDARDQLRALVDDHPPAADRALQATSRRQARGAALTPDLRRDPLSGRTVVVAPARARRPGLARAAIGAPDAGRAGRRARSARDARTGRRPETYAVAPPRARHPTLRAGRSASSPTSIPALERQEVVVHSPRHARSLAELEDDEVAAVATGLARSAARQHAERASPTSSSCSTRARRQARALPHSHSQLVWLREQPPAVVEELPAAPGGQLRRCASVLRRRELEIALRGDVSLLAAPGRPCPVRARCSRRSKHAAEPSRGRPRRRSSLLRTRSAGYARPRGRSR